MNRKAFKYRIYPNTTQEKNLNQTLKTCQLLYNEALSDRIEYYQATISSLSYKQQANALSKIKNYYQEQLHSQVFHNICLIVVHYWLL